MPDGAKPRRQPRFSVPGRFGLPDGAPWTGIPIAFFRFTKAAELPAGHILVLQALLCLWRPEAGNILRAPIRQLVDLLPIQKSQVSAALNELAARGLIGYLPVPRQPSDVDLSPLLAHVRETHRTGRLARPETQQLALALVSAPPDTISPPSVSAPPDSPVRYFDQPVRSSSLAAGSPESEKDSRGGVFVSGEPPNTPRDQSAPHGPEDDNGTGTASAAKVIAEIRDRLDPQRPRTAGLSAEERAAHAARVREQALGFEQPPAAAES
jgi:hypothetical protein